MAFFCKVASKHSIILWQALRGEVLLRLDSEYLHGAFFCKVVSKHSILWQALRGEVPLRLDHTTY